MAMRRLVVVLALLAAAGGCGTLSTARTLFPEHVIDAAGSPLYLEDLRAIVDDADLLDDEKADALRELGLENEEIIDAIIADGLRGSAASTDGISASKLGQ